MIWFQKCRTDKNVCPTLPGLFHLNIEDRQECLSYQALLRTKMQLFAKITWVCTSGEIKEDKWGLP
jgi:hypothetical protein